MRIVEEFIRNGARGQFGPARISKTKRAEPPQHWRGGRIPRRLLYNRLDQAVNACEPTCRYPLWEPGYHWGSFVWAGHFVSLAGIAGVGGIWLTCWNLWDFTQGKGIGRLGMHGDEWRKRHTEWMIKFMTQIWCQLEPLILWCFYVWIPWLLFHMMSGRTRWDAMFCLQTRRLREKNGAH